ncbi:MAG TPA: DUF4175 family protein [Gammaproteobacteria bacterium]|nr:DUF4175 family protein [Gammaproteobacteria bacterium]
MSSPTFESLRAILKSLRRRRSNLFFLKQGSYFVIGVATLVLAVSGLAAWQELDKTGITVLFIVSLAGLVLLLWRLVWVLNRSHTDDRRMAHYVEDHIPDLEQRLLTSLEFTDEDLVHGKAGVSQQFIQQLWQDAQAHVQQQQYEVETVTPAKGSWFSFGSASAVVAIVVGIFLTSDILMIAGSRLVWPFAISEPTVVVEVFADIEISIEPGDLEMQRGDSVTIIARVTNAIPGAVNLRLQDDNVNWRDASMSRDGSGSESATYSYFIPALQEDTTYYVTFNERGEHNSPQYQIDLFDLPQIEQIDLAFDYPEYTEIEDILEEDSGDMIVPEGTRIDFTVTFNKAIASANVEFDESYRADEEEVNPNPPYPDIELSLDGNIGTGSFTVNQDGVYRIHATDFSDLSSKNPLDYFIRAIEDTPPELALQRPGRDEEVMPLEEVILEVSASDDYGLSEFTLNYSVVGTGEVEVDFLPEANVRSVSGNELIYLEDLEVEPGDFVSYFLTLADNNGLQGPAEVISDIYFLQIIPTDQEFRRNPSMSGGQGAGGGQGGDSSALVSIQKDIIAATWKLKNRQSKVSPEAFSNDAEIIAESQKEATGRARMSIDRLVERLNFSDDTYDAAVENLSLAIDQMNLAAGELDLEQVTSALQPEQLALQHLLRAEASINRTNISMQQGGGGGGGGAQQEREDLRELFEMEMGQLENRYETPNSAGGGSQENQEEVNKLEELARRQEGLTRAQRNLARREKQMTEEQKRRELERLMRQQEQLSREVAQLAQQLSRGQQSSQSQSQSGQQSQSQSQSQSQAQSSSSGGSSGGQQQPQTALERAAQQMQEAAESETASIAAARSQKALENLREQQREMNKEGERSVNQLAQNLGQRGQQLLQQQRDLQESLQEATRQQGLGQTRQSVRSDESMQELIESQQQQQRDLEEIEDMLRAIIARGDSDDQRLMSQAQEASRDLRPIREEMQTSNRVLRNGMVNLSVDIERELEGEIEDFAQSLAALNPSRGDSASDQIQQAARDAADLREQIEALEQQALAFNEAGQQAGAGTPSVRELRDQLQRSQQLAQSLQQQLQQQAQGGGQQPGGQQPGGQQPGGQQSGGQQPGSQPGGANAQGGRQQIGGARGGNQDQAGIGGRVTTDGNNSPWGNARSIRQQLTQQGIEDFLNQPELFRGLLQPILELEGALRAQAELDNINNKLFATVDEDVPDEYRELVEEYYRVLSENPGSANQAQ